jgi:Methyltransferase domain
MKIPGARLLRSFLKRQKKKFVKVQGVKPGAFRVGFFSNYPRFGETSTVASNIARLNFRYEHVIAQNRHLIEGRRVLDLASHDGRFSFAALKGAGAKHVTGIEARGNLVKHSRETFAHYGMNESSYSFIEGDIFEEIGKIEPGSIDTVLVLGFLYHTARHYELASAISKIGATALVIDSNVIANDPRPIIQLKWEGTESDAQIWDASRKQVLSSKPTATAIQMFFEEFGYKMKPLEVTVETPPAAAEYRTRARVTLTGTRDRQK